MAVWAWYTKGRRLPTLIGKDVSGKRIPGGPYTGLQAVTVLVVPSLGWTTRGLWAAQMTGLVMLGTIVLATVAAVKLVAKADFASRNPLLLLHSYLRELGRPVGGQLAGRKLPDRRPHRVRAATEAADLALTTSGSVQPEDVAEPAAAIADPVPAAAVSVQPAATRTDRRDPATGGPAAVLDEIDSPVAVEPSATGPEQPPARPVIRPAVTPAGRRSALEDFLSASTTLTKDAA